MANTLRRVQSGWLSKSIEDAKRFEQANHPWVVQVRSNWVGSGSVEQVPPPKKPK